MVRKNILIISRSFYPDISPRSFRTTELAKEFAKQGHYVTVLTHKKKENSIYFNFETKYNIKIKNLGKNILPRIKFGNNKYINLFKRAFSRGLNLLFVYPDIELVVLVRRALVREKNYDLLISIAVPHSTHWGVALSRNKKIAKTWVADCGDPFMGTNTDSFKKLFYFEYIEKWWSKKADYITVPFKGSVEAYYKEFHNKIKVIPQGFNFNEIKIDEENYKPNRVPTFAYIGLLISGSRDPRPFIEYLLELNIEFKFILYNKQESLFKDLIDRAGGMIEFRDYIERKTLIKILSKMDFIINFNNRTSTQLPSKLIDYYLTKRPVLSIESYSFDKEIVFQFLKGDYSRQFVYDNPEQYKIQNICQKFLDLA